MSRKLGRARRAADVFKTCPRCGSPNVLTVEADVICTYCDWSSLNVDAPAAYRNVSVSVPTDSDRESPRPGSLAAAVEKILEENPFLTGEPVFA